MTSKQDNGTELAEGCRQPQLQVLCSLLRSRYPGARGLANFLSGAYGCIQKDGSVRRYEEVLAERGIRIETMDFSRAERYIIEGGGYDVLIASWENADLIELSRAKRPSALIALSESSDCLDSPRELDIDGKWVYLTDRLRCRRPEVIIPYLKKTYDGKVDFFEIQSCHERPKPDERVLKILSGLGLRS